MDLVPTTELEAINAMLRGIGESPVNSVEDTGNADAVMARQALHFTSSLVQEEGWHWNTMRELALPRSFPSNEIFVPISTLKVDTVKEDADRDAILRGNRLFDKDNNTYAWDKTLKVDLVEFLDFATLPQAARIFITLKATQRFQEDRVGSDTLSAFQRREMERAHAALVEAEAETSDYSIFNSYSVMRALDR